MIKYTLQCDKGHQFESWFQSASAFDGQVETGLGTCPYCGSHSVRKTLMAPAVTGTKKSKVTVPEPMEPEANTPTPQAPIPAAQPPAPTAPSHLVPPPELVEAFVEKVREVRSFVEANADNVGDKFAEEARKIHYGEEEARGIFGQMNEDEAEELIEEGVDFLALPTLPEDRN